MRTVMLVALAAPAVVTACGRWVPPRTFEVQHTADAERTFAVVQQVVQDENYRVVERDEANRTLKLRTRIDEVSKSRVTFITVVVADTGQISLTPSGYLVRADGRLHHGLNKELARLERQIDSRLNGGLVVSGDQVDGGGQEPAPTTDESGVPMAWLEASSDPAKAADGKLTCIPAHIPAEESGTIGLRLSNGEMADITLALAYDPSLCQSAAACPSEEGCPALGLSDEQQVAALAQRLRNGDIEPKATLVYRGQPVAVVDLSQHGSIVRAPVDM